MSVSDTPVAVIGAACRLPSANSVAQFWDVLASGRCVISEVNEDRFGHAHLKAADRSTPGRAVTFAAGQIDDPFGFDPGYFGISPREAAVMDPQQRILLEVTAEALNDAGIPAASLAGLEVGVYVGASSLDYSYHSVADPTTIEPQSMLGNTLSIIANRLSYVFDLKGPSYTVDTACSSSLIALHNALEDIRRGRVDTAIVAGVSILMSFVPFVGFSRAQMLSANGLCRAFDAGADGYVRSEGAVTLVIRAEESARSGGDPIRARLLASGVNADGRTPGLSLPSSTAQADLLRAVYTRAEIDPARLAFMEAHGTGTPVGDPIEANAIGTVLGTVRTAPLPMGSSKTNFGHLEPASGLVGVLKAAEALRHDTLPASLHFEVPNPHIPFADLNLEVAGTAQALAPVDGAPRLAGVNSFGFGGANAHVVVGDGERRAMPDVPERAQPILVSAASAEALRAMAGALAARVENAGPPAIANALAHGRDRLAHRALIAPAPVADMRSALEAVADGEEHAGAHVGEALSARAAPVFVYSGNGSQWAGMGRAAYQGEAEFRASFERVDRLFMSVAGWSLVTTLFSADLEAEIERTEIAQPLLFALQVALTEALGRQGLRPAAVMGHSVGEVAASWAAGALSLADAVRVIHARSTHQEVTRHLGGMAALLLPAEEAEAAIASHPGLELAAVNSPRSVTISGPSDTLAAFRKRARAERWVIKPLPLDYPFHCALVDPIRDPLLAALSAIKPRATILPLLSTVTGEVIDGEALGADYWWRNVREPVRFADALTAALADHSLFVEVGPRAVLTGYINDTARTAERPATVLPSLSQPAKGREETTDPVADTVRRALVAGADVDDAQVFGPPTAMPDILPAYPFQRAYHRAERSVEEVRVMRPLDHALLGQRLRGDDTEWRTTLSVDRLPFLADHTVEGAVVFPAAGFMEMVLAAAAALHPGSALEVSNVDIVAALVLDRAYEREVRTALIAPGTILISSRPRLSADGWMPHVKATISAAPAEPVGDAVPDTASGIAMHAAALYALTGEFGLPYGPAFRRAEEVRVAGPHGHVRLAAPDPAMAAHSFRLDPTLFDACFHGLFAFIGAADEEAGAAVALLPVRLGRLRLSADAAVPTSATFTVERPAADVAEADFTLRDAGGRVVARAEGVRFQAVPLGAQKPSPLHAVPSLRRLARARDVSTLDVTVPTHLTAAEVEPSDTALLVEAGVQAAAAEALAPLLTPPSSLDALVAAGRLARDAQPLAARLLLALEAAGLAEETDGAWALGAAASTGDVVGLLVADHPERLAEAAAIAALPDRLAAAFAGGLDAVPHLPDALGQMLLHDAPGASALFDALDATLAVLSAGHEGSLSIALVGADNLAFVRRAATHVDPSRMELVVTDADAGAVERAAMVIARSPGVRFLPMEAALAEGHLQDAVFLAPRLAAPDLASAALLKPGGHLMATAFAPGLFADAVGGFGGAWWAGSLDPSAPIGLLADAAEWEGAIAAAGLEARTISPLASGDADALLIHAHRRPTDSEPAPLVWPELQSMGARAGKVVDALAAMSPEATPEEDAEPGLVLAVSAETADELPVLLGDTGRALQAVGTDPRTVTLVTFGAHGEADRTLIPAGAALAAFARTAMNEFPHLSVRIVDLSPALAPSEAAVRLLRELEQPNDEREVALFSDHRSAVRYRPAPKTPAGGEERVLAIPRRGSIDNLVWAERDRTALEPREVRIRVEATGLNFRDVMWTLGLLPHEALEDGFAGPTLGMECAGVIEAAGDDVTGLAVGDAVIAFAPASFATHATLPAEAVVTRPAGLAAEAAATIPVAFLTAYYALVELARLGEGETVLIHGGAGGVGLAALQIAKLRGARVFATAGSPEKRALLKHLGADAIFDSRALTFADEAREATGGEGVDVVLNSLAGEAMERSLGTLKPFGRFLELGKRDFYADTKLGLRPFRQNLSYFGIDADQLMRHRPALAKSLLGRLMAHFADGELTPLPYRSFAPEAVHDAFRLMQSAGHVGKIVVRAPATPAPVEPPAPTVIAAEGTYLLLGGTSGFGFATAEWLIAEGARHLVLASRSGVKDPAIAEAIARHRAAGVSIVEAAVDVTDADALREVVGAIDPAHPLTGVLHMAMVLDDALIASLDTERHRTVLAPKALGVEALEAAIADVELSAFVLYSSITVQLGNPGQANYVAANAYLEAVARRRRAAGKPALAVAWGAISDVGVLARDSATSELLQKKLGRHAMSSSEALASLGRLLRDGAMTTGDAVHVVGQVDWAAARKDLVLVASPSFADLAMGSEADGEDAGTIDLAARLAGLSEAEAVAEVSRMLGAEIAKILKLPASEVDPKKPLTALGMDSLMALELRMAAEQRLGIEVPLMSLASGATIADIAKKVVARALGLEDAGGVAADAAARHVDAASTSDDAVRELAATIESRGDNVRSLLS